MNKSVRRGYALLWRRFYWLRYRLPVWTTRHGATAGAIGLLLLVVASTLLTSRIQQMLEPYFATGQKLMDLRTLLVTLGGALVGATAIAFSVVVFAVQMNFARMPHGLFHKLSSDRRLLGTFFATFALALGVATLSIIVQQSRLAITVLGAAWASVLILLLFRYAYRRALFLIDPSEQIRLVAASAHREMGAWVRRARRAAPLFERAKPSEDTSIPHSSHDLARTAFFQANPHWTDESRRAMTHAVSFARRYAEEGDHEVARIALIAVVSINTKYVAAKGKTFFTRHLLFDNPLATDGFINESLEHLRQTMRIAVSRGDERQIVDTLQTMTTLAQVYMSIDYASQYAEKTHTHIAAGYLSAAIQSVTPHNMPDVLMEGIRLMRQLAQVFLAASKPNDIATLVEKIAIVACMGVAKENHRPVTMSGVEALAHLTLNVLRTRSGDIRFAAQELKRNVSLIARLFLEAPNAPVMSDPSAHLGPYYSATSTQSLASWLTELTTAVTKADAEDEAARAIVQNVERWADGLYRTEKELLLAAIERRAHFTFDVIHWIAHVMSALLAMSNAPACDDLIRDHLQAHALWLISVLGWIPNDEETIGFVENFGVTETLFEAAVAAHAYRSGRVVSGTRELLLSWAFGAGRHHNGWAILERSMYGLATLAFRTSGVDESCELKAAIAAALAKPDAPDQELRERAASEIDRTAATFSGHNGVSAIEHAMAQVDRAKLRALLRDIANLLSPGRTPEAR